MLTIFGASDDLVEFRGIVYDEVSCYDRDVRVTVGDGDAGVCVVMSYGTRGSPGWSAELQLVEPSEQLSETGRESARIPWPITVRECHEPQTDERDYTIVVDIDCPEGTPVKWETEPTR